MNYAVYPCKVMRITQNYKGKTSHYPHTAGTPKDYPVDEGCSDTGREWLYCPCDEMKVRRIYGVGTGGTNTLWLESTQAVDFADGTSDILTVMVTHPDDEDMKKLKVGDIFRRGEKIVREGKDGATANHLHISAGKGRMKGSGWMLNSKNKWVLATSAVTAKPEDIFYIDPDFTRVISSGSLKFKTLPEKYKTGYYKVNTAVLNVRYGPGTAYKKLGILTKGKSMRISETKNNWGSFGKDKWVCLDYCKYM